MGKGSLSAGKGPFRYHVHGQSLFSTVLRLVHLATTNTEHLPRPWLTGAARSVVALSNGWTVSIVDVLLDAG